MANPIKTYTLFKKAGAEALEYFDKNIRKLPKNSKDEIDIYSAELHNTDADAFRHAYVSGVFTQEFNEVVANRYGKINEIHSNLFGQPEVEENMDLWNNAIGRDYGKKTKSRKELAESLKKALENEELIITIDQEKDPRKYKEKSSQDIDHEKPIIVIEESETGRNEMFLDLITGQVMNREVFVSQIQSGGYPGYLVSMIDNIPTPMSKPDGTVDNNLG